MPSEIDRPGRDPSLPTETLIHTVEATTTTTTMPVAAIEPTRQSRRRSTSRDALSALTSPRMPLTSPLKADDYGFPSQRQEEEHDATKTELSGYEAFPSFDSWSPRPRFSLTRSLSLRSAAVSQPARAGQGGARMLRSLTADGHSRAGGETAPPLHNLEDEAGREAWMGEALARTQVCLWAGQWRRRSSGEFICPCGEHSLGADSPWVRSLEDKMRERSQDAGDKEV